jgi:ribosome maturation factor RimP
MEAFHRQLAEQVSAEIGPVIAAMGFDLVEAHVGAAKNQSLVSVIIYRKDGVGIDDCAAVSRNIYPRLELIENLGNFSLEVSSPGTDRVLKNRNEYDIFLGRMVSVLTNESNEWINGIIDHVNDDSVYLNKKGDVVSIRFDTIKKTRLENSFEEGK